MNYVVGDVHGYYDCLTKLLNKLKNIENVYFVGDIIDRGPDSKKIIDLIKNNKNYYIVLGNHEDLMINIGSTFLQNYKKMIKNQNEYKKWYQKVGNNWIRNGGDKTLESYNLYNSNINKILINNGKIKEFQEDIEWMKKLPLYIELKNKEINNKNIIISHSSCLNIWNNKKDISEREFKDYILWNREEIIENPEIFNIFGHTPIYFGPKLENHYINIDSGVYKKIFGFNRITAFCIETKECFFQDNI